MKNNDLLDFMQITDEQLKNAKKITDKQIKDKKEIQKELSTSISNSKQKTYKQIGNSELTGEFIYFLKNKKEKKNIIPTSIRMEPYTKELIKNLSKETKRSESFIINALLKKVLKIK